MAYRQPVGVVFGIAPWNAPIILGVRAQLVTVDGRQVEVSPVRAKHAASAAGNRPRRLEVFGIMGHLDETG